MPKRNTWKLIYGPKCGTIKTTTMYNYILTGFLESNTHLMRGRQNRYMKVFKPYEKTRMYVPLDSGNVIAFSINLKIGSHSIETMKKAGEALDKYMINNSQNFVA